MWVIKNIGEFIWLIIGLTFSTIGELQLRVQEDLQVQVESWMVYTF